MFPKLLVFSSKQKSVLVRLFPVALLSVLVCLVLVILSLSFKRRSSTHNDLSQNVSNSQRASVMLYDTEKLQEVNLSILVEPLSSENEVIREAARKEIILLAKQSNKNRSEIIIEIMSSVEMPGFKYKLDQPPNSRLWASAAQILSELKAIESIDLLIKCIDCVAATEHVSESYYHRPAIRALIGMGEIAVPKLSDALYNNDPQVRSYAALCLSAIGGEAARIALIHALNVETDDTVRLNIKDAINTIDRTTLKR